jgi:hypothetical protein
MSTHSLTRKGRWGLCQSLILIDGLCLLGLTADKAPRYAGKPFHDSGYHAGPQAIRGRVQCAYYDSGGEGIA